MLTSPDDRSTRIAEADPPDATSTLVADLAARVAGLGAIGFVVVGLFQNVVRGALAPQNGAPTQDVLNYYADHRSVSVLLSATFVLGGACLAAFLGGAMRRLATGPRPAWAFTGFAGAIGIIALFSTVVGTESALSVVAARPAPSLAAVDALWALHNGVFAVLLLSIGIAVIGLARAGTAAGITPHAFDWLAPMGFVMLALAAATGPLHAAGDAMALFALGGIGFLIWLAFLATTGARLIRGR